MAPARQNLLIIDDEENMRHMLQALLQESGYQVETAENGLVALRLVEQNIYDYILCDIKMPQMDGMAFLQAAKPFLDHSTVIMMSAYGSMDTALEAIKAGAYDFISKPFKTDEVLLTLKKVEEREALRQENRMLREEIETVRGESDFGTLIGRSKAMRDLFKLAHKVAFYNTTVLVTGESGTGKELVARGLHAHSPREHMPFIAINCGSIPENLLESEFFGHVRGAFTGADTNKKGIFAEAEGGTLFLDEIGELPRGLQVKLLRVLQESEIRPVGSTKTRKIDVRIIAATAKDLNEEVQLGTFREDLYYRLNVLSIHIPPLRARPDDIALLANHFLVKVNRKLNTAVKAISPAALSLLIQHSWPGNARELENTIERGVIMANQDVILPENIPQLTSEKREDRRLTDFFPSYSIKESGQHMERNLIQRALDATNGNKSQASKLLEISYPSLLSKIKKQGIQIGRFYSLKPFRPKAVRNGYAVS
jgi:two-component system response regulator AtoC